MRYEVEQDLLSWEHFVFAAATIITVPLYLLILWVIWWRPKLTLFHVLMLSQGIADIIFLLSYNFFVTLRLTMICYNFFWRYRRFLANIMTEIPVAVFVIVHWFSALLVTAPLLTSFDATYLPDMNSDIPTDDLSLANLISVISVVVLFVICAFCYVLVLLHMLRSKVSVNTTKQNEIRLSIQVAGLMIAFVLVFIYNVGQYIILQSEMVG
ncbi:unnamed protein product [Cylicocyclus nassatus]|uniref:Uncharacterized protein n=1 Tax=Cylicocyclus nassatus TaxID=53992 RepID=A0AA36GWD3_CYLNA|nr:unnamed protein product [Cylicocyclus nassatus]